MTKLDEIAEMVFDIVAECDAKKSRGLRDAMRNYQATRSTTLRDLRKTPGFRKLWDAIDAAVVASALDVGD